MKARSPMNFVENITKAMKKNSLSIEYIVVDNEGHGFHKRI